MLLKRLQNVQPTQQPFKKEHSIVLHIYKAEKSTFPITELSQNKIGYFIFYI